MSKEELKFICDEIDRTCYKTYLRSLGIKPRSERIDQPEQMYEL